VWSTSTKHQTSTSVTHLGEAELLHNISSPKRGSQEEEDAVNECSNSLSSGSSFIKK